MGAHTRRVGLMLALPAVLSAIPVHAVELPETSVSYTIEVSLDPETRRLDGHETVRWTNPSSRSIDAVPMHLYLNGFAHEETTWMRGVPPGRFDIDQLLDRYENPWGWNEPVSIRRAGVELDWKAIAPDDGNPLDRSLIEVALDRPLAPGEVLELDIECEARLPIPIARTGGRDDYFLVAQWFPKVAMLETVGVRGATEDRFNAHQFHGPTEFYAEYADFDVRIGVPAGFSVVATGQGGPEGEATDGGVVWHRYRQRAVHDFAFATGQHMVDVVSTHDPAGPGGPVTIHIFLPAGTEHQAERWRRIAEAGLDVMGEDVGPYPYETLSVIFAPWWADETLGMEYPTLITAGPGDPLWDTDIFSSLRLGELVTSHEFAHQYFYGLVGSNEFEEAYLDEGFTEYWGDRILNAAYGEESAGGSLLGRSLSTTALEVMGLPDKRELAQAVWSGDSYLARDGYKFAQFYNVPALTMVTAEGLFGRETVDRVFAEYFRRWAFRHPRFEDFLEVARETGGAEFADFVLESYTATRQPDYRIVTMDTEVWARPRGRLVTPEGVIDPAAVDDELKLAGLDPAAREDNAVILAEVHDPGRGRDEPGGIERRTFEPEQVEPDEDWEAEDDVFHESRVRIAGSSWTHLPVDIHFRFADGALIRERWDGHGDYRQYRFVRAAPLSEVHVDPAGINLLDPDPANNAQTRKPDEALIGDWSRWLGGVFQLVFEGLGQWL